MNDDFLESLITKEIFDQKKELSIKKINDNFLNLDSEYNSIMKDVTNSNDDSTKLNTSNQKIIKDPRKDILLNIYASHSKEKSSSHHYLQRLRFCGTIYNKKTYAAMFHEDYQSCKLFSSMLDPPPIWLTPSMGASADYINGSFHFPYFLTGDNSKLSSKTINRKKLSSSYYMMICAQIAAKKILLDKNGGQPFNDIFFDFKFPLDTSTQELVDAFLGKTNFHGKEYIPRKITVEQTKELLHAWIQVYLFQKNEFLNILNFYLYAGYVVSVTTGHGGLHIQQSLPTHPSKLTPVFHQYQKSIQKTNKIENKSNNETKIANENQTKITNENIITKVNENKMEIDDIDLDIDFENFIKSHEKDIHQDNDEFDFLFD